MLPPLPSVPTLRNVQDVQDVCRNVVHTGKGSNHFEDRSLSWPLSSSWSMHIFYFLTNPNVMDHLFADNGLQILMNALALISIRNKMRRLHRTCPLP